MKAKKIFVLGCVQLILCVVAIYRNDAIGSALFSGLCVGEFLAFFYINENHSIEGK